MPTDQTTGATDMRRKQAGGTWVDTSTSLLCLDHNGLPIKAGACLVTGYNGTYIGRLLGAGKNGTWRVRNRFTREVTAEAGSCIICALRLDGDTIPCNLRNALSYVRRTLGGLPVFCKPVLDRFIRYANRLPREERLPFILKHYSNPSGCIVNATVDGDLYLGDPRIGNVIQVADLPSELRAYDTRNIRFYACPDDSRYRHCDRCTDFNLVANTTATVWRGVVSGNRMLCRACLAGVSGGTDYHNDRELRTSITTDSSGTIIVTTAYRPVRISQPESVQAYSTRVESALPWIGKAEFHLGLEVEGYAPSNKVGRLCGRLYKAGLALGKSDSSIRPANNCTGVEVVTAPIACTPEVYRPALAKLAKVLSAYSFGSNFSCGGHIHVSANAFSKGMIARIKYALAKYPAGWELIFGRPFNGYCAADGSYERYLRDNRIRRGNALGNGNILDALAINNRGAVNPNTPHGTHEFRAFASVYTLPRLLANFETVLAIRQWVLSMPSDWSLAGYLRFLQAREGADTYSKSLIHYRGRLASDPFDALTEGMSLDALPLAYARALAVSALVRIRMARVKAYRPPATSKGKGKTVREVAIARFMAWSNYGVYNRTGLPHSLDLYLRETKPLHDTVIVAERDGLVLRVATEEASLLDKPHVDPDKPRKNMLSREVLSLAV